MSEALGIEKARQIVAQVFGDFPASTPFLVGQGMVNRVYGVRVVGEDLVVRLCDDEGAAQEHQKEAWCLGRAASVGIPGPAVRAIGTLASTSYLVQTLLSGVKGEEAQAEWPHLWRELGRFAYLIHSIPVTGFGGHLADAECGVFGNGHTSTWIEMVDYNIQSLTADDALLDLAVYSASQRPLIVDAFTRLHDYSFRFGLCHNDLKPQNTIVGPTGEVSLLDWGSATVHIVPHIDLVEILRRQDPEGDAVRSYLDGYGLSRAEFETLLPQVETIQLLRAFDLVRWALDRRPERLAACAARAKRVLKRHLEKSPWEADQIAA